MDNKDKLLWKLAELVRQTQVSQLNDEEHQEFCEDRLLEISELLNQLGYNPFKSRNNLQESEWRPLIEWRPKKPTKIYEVYDSYCANHAYFSTKKLAEDYIASCGGEPKQFQIYEHSLDVKVWE